ncbi:MAG: hypothetical protein ABIH89_00830 [Elusimicrobiota bacterium]
MNEKKISEFPAGQEGCCIFCKKYFIIEPDHPGARLDYDCEGEVVYDETTGLKKQSTKIVMGIKSTAMQIQASQYARVPAGRKNIRHNTLIPQTHFFKKFVLNIFISGVIVPFCI